MAAAKKTTIGAYVELAGSEKPMEMGKSAGLVDANEIINVTIRTRRKKSIEAALKNGKIIDHETYEKQYGTAAEDFEAIEEFAQQYHLTIVERSAPRRTVIIAGRVSSFEAAFQVHLSNYINTDGTIFRGRVGCIYIPANLEGIIEGVFGLSNKPHATPKSQLLNKEGKIISHAAAAGSFTPDQLARIYGFPKGVDGTGQCIGIIELGGGFRNIDLQNYFKGLGIAMPAIKAQSVDGGLNKPSNANSDDGEVMLDIEVAGAVAPGAKQVVYFAGNTDKGFIDAVTTAIHDKVNNPSVISISWGSAEANWTTQALNSFNEAFKAASLLGVTICIASGDQGSSDSVTDGKVHVDFPASSPYVLACGGTKLITTGNKVSKETVWNEGTTSAGGGGVSEVFPVPDYQKKTAIPVSASTKFKGRGVPDVAANADPSTGYQVLVDGQKLVFGGTSAVAPLMAGLIALLNQKNKNRAGFVNPRLYATPQKFCRDITEGNNITTSTKLGYAAAKGWDACTGWGVMNII
ncbi:MAG TPA: S53 family peptidase [Ferruginibacter sp.]|jgi:kumamolisin|nr:S53 family peptidase [Ferruginibacter sp.]